MGKCDRVQCNKLGELARLVPSNFPLCPFVFRDKDGLLIGHREGISPVKVL